MCSGGDVCVCGEGGVYMGKCVCVGRGCVHGEMCVCGGCVYVGRGVCGGCVWEGMCVWEDV